MAKRYPLQVSGIFEDKENPTNLTYAEIFHISPVGVGADPNALGFTSIEKPVKKEIDKTREKVKTIVKDASADNQSMNLTHVKNNIRDKVGQFLYTKTQRRPMVLPVIIRV